MACNHTDEYYEKTELLYGHLWRDANISTIIENGEFHIWIEFTHPMKLKPIFCGGIVFIAINEYEFVSLKSGIIEIADNAFRNSPILKSVKFPDSVISIGRKVFENCYELSEIKFSKALRTIGLDAFANCPKLKKPEFSDDVVVEKNFWENAHE